MNPIITAARAHYDTLPPAMRARQTAWHLLAVIHEAERLERAIELAHEGLAIQQGTTTSSRYWVKHEWDKEEPACVRCGHTMDLNDGCEWDDDYRMNLCHGCALTIIREKVIDSLPVQGA